MYGFLISLVSVAAIKVIRPPIIASIKVDVTRFTSAQPTASPTIDDGINIGKSAKPSAGRICMNGAVAKLPSGNVSAIYSPATIPLLAIDLLVIFII